MTPVDAVHADAIDVLSRWYAPTPDQLTLREDYLSLLASRPDATRRSCWPQHLTASAVVFDPTLTRVAMVLHGRVHLWLPPGGHVEDSDTRLIDTAVREAQEELGIEAVAPITDAPVVLDRHAAPCRPGVTDGSHLDVCFALVTTAATDLTVSDESHDVGWFAVDDLPDHVPASLRPQLDQALVSIESRSGSIRS